MCLLARGCDHAAALARVSGSGHEHSVESSAKERALDSTGAVHMHPARNTRKLRGARVRVVARASSRTRGGRTRRSVGQGRASAHVERTRRGVRSVSHAPEERVGAHARTRARGSARVGRGSTRVGAHAWERMRGSARVGAHAWARVGAHAWERTRGSASVGAHAWDMKLWFLIGKTLGAAGNCGFA